MCVCVCVCVCVFWGGTFDHFNITRRDVLHIIFLHNIRAAHTDTHTHDKHGTQGTAETAMLSVESYKVPQTHPHPHHALTTYTYTPNKHTHTHIHTKSQTWVSTVKLPNNNGDYTERVIKTPVIFAVHNSPI